MKRTFKKAISLLLSVLMLVSLCTIAITTVSAEEITINDLGVTGGNFVSQEKIANDPTDANVKVLHFYADKNRPNFELANPTNKSEAFQPASGTVYTVMFDYYVKTCTQGFDFTLYYGNESVGGAGRSDSFVQSKSGFSTKFIGDGKWHTGAITFNAQDVKKSDVLLKKIYLTYYSSGIFEGYIKNLNIITETFSNGFYDSFSTNMTYYYNSDGTANLNLINGSCASAVKNSYKDEDGRLVVVPTSNNNAGNGAEGSVQYLTVLKSNNKNEPVILKTGATYKLKLKYKVIDVAGGTVHVGLGHGANTSTSGWTGTYVIKRNTHTAVTNGFTTLETTFTATKDATFRIYVSRANSKIVIDSVELVAEFADNDKVAEMTYNDNGNITKIMAYVGTDHTVFADNGYLGEKSQGWCSDTALTNVVADKVSNDYTSLYAKYNTVVIDKMNFTSLVKDWDYAGTASVSNGTITTNSSSNMAIVLPAYDAPNTSGNGAGYDYYSFQKGQRYIVQIHLNSIKDTAGYTRALELMGATAAGNKGARDTSIACAATPSLRTTDDGVALTNKIAVYQFTRAAGNKGWETCAMGLRSGNDKANFTMEIDKIIITKMDGNENYAVAHNDYDNSYQFVKLGDSIVLPEVADKEDSIFVGWYNNVTTASSHNISTSDISIPAGAPYKLTKSGIYQFKANFLSKESVTVDFSEEIYGTLKNGTDLGGSAGQMKIVTDEAIDTEGLSTDNTYLRLYTDAQNIFKTSLYHDNGNRFYATNDVTYNFEIRYKVVTPDTSARTEGYIGICRNPAGGYVPKSLDGINSNCTYLASAKEVTENFVTVSKDLKVTNLYYNDGDSPNLKAQLSVMICQGDIWVDYIKVTPVSYDPEYVVYDETKGDVTVDYENGIITAIPKEGYALSTKDIVVKMTYRDYVYDSGAGKVILSAKDADQKLNLNTTDGVNFSFNTNAYNNYNEKIGALKFYVNFVDATATDNANFLAVSYRENKDDNGEGEYQSAGIRFRARFSKATMENAAEMGFIIVPKKLVDAAEVNNVGGYMGKVADGTVADRSAKGVAYNKATDINVLYSQVGDFSDYQAVLTGLTTKDGKDLTSLDMCIAAYVTDADGNTTYIELGTAYSYKTIVAMGK